MSTGGERASFWERWGIKSFLSNALTFVTPSYWTSLNPKVKRAYELKSNENKRNFQKEAQKFLKNYIKITSIQEGKEGKEGKDAKSAVYRLEKYPNIYLERIDTWVELEHDLEIVNNLIGPDSDEEKKERENAASLLTPDLLLALEEERKELERRINIFKERYIKISTYDGVNKRLTEKKTDKKNESTTESFEPELDLSYKEDRELWEKFGQYKINLRKTFMTNEEIKSLSRDLKVLRDKPKPTQEETYKTVELEYKIEGSKNTINILVLEGNKIENEIKDLLIKFNNNYNYRTILKNIKKSREDYDKYLTTLTEAESSLDSVLSGKKMSKSQSHYENIIATTKEKIKEEQKYIQTLCYEKREWEKKYLGKVKTIPSFQEDEYGRSVTVEIVEPCGLPQEAPEEEKPARSWGALPAGPKTGAKYLHGALPAPPVYYKNDTSILIFSWDTSGLRICEGYDGGMNRTWFKKMRKECTSPEFMREVETYISYVQPVLVVFSTQNEPKTDSFFHTEFLPERMKEIRSGGYSRVRYARTPGVGESKALRELEYRKGEMYGKHSYMSTSIYAQNGPVYNNIIEMDKKSKAVAQVKQRWPVGWEVFAREGADKRLEKSGVNVFLISLFNLNIVFVAVHIIRENIFGSTTDLEKEMSENLNLEIITKMYRNTIETIEGTVDVAASFFFGNFSSEVSFGPGNKFGDIINSDDLWRTRKSSDSFLANFQETNDKQNPLAKLAPTWNMKIGRSLGQGSSCGMGLIE